METSPLRSARSLYRTPGGTVTTTAAGNTPITTLDTAGNTIQVRNGMIFRPTDHMAYAGNVIPVNTFDSVSRPRCSPATRIRPRRALSNNFTRTANEPDQQDQFDVRLDHRFSERDQMFGRYSYFRDDTSPVTALPDGSGAAAAGSLATGPQQTLGQSFASNYLHTFSSNLLNEVRVGYTRRSISRAALLLPAPPSQSLALPGIPTNAAFNNELPTFYCQRMFRPWARQRAWIPSFAPTQSKSPTRVSWLHGRHAFKFGADFRIFRLDVIQPPSPTGVVHLQHAVHGPERRDRHRKHAGQLPDRSGADVFHRLAATEAAPARLVPGMVRAGHLETDAAADAQRRACARR